MAIVRWEPFRDLVSLQDRMNRIFDDAFRGQRSAQDDWALGGSWAPSVDIYEHNGSLVLKAELPGIDPKDVDVRVEEGETVTRGQVLLVLEAMKMQHAIASDVDGVVRVVRAKAGAQASPRALLVEIESTEGR